MNRGVTVIPELFPAGLNGELTGKRYEGEERREEEERRRGEKERRGEERRGEERGGEERRRVDWIEEESATSFLQRSCWRRWCGSGTLLRPSPSSPGSGAPWTCSSWRPRRSEVTRRSGDNLDDKVNNLRGILEPEIALKYHDNAQNWYTLVKHDSHLKSTAFGDRALSGKALATGGSLLCVRATV